MAGYEIHVEPGMVMDFDLGLQNVVTAEIVYVEENGTITRTGIRRSANSGADQRRLRAPLNIQLGRLRHHLESTGKRWELEQRLKSEAARAVRKAERQARADARNAGPELLTALEAMLNAVKKRKVAGMDATIAQAERAIAKANGAT